MVPSLYISVEYRIYSRKRRHDIHEMSIKYTDHKTPSTTTDDKTFSKSPQNIRSLKYVLREGGIKQSAKMFTV